MVVAKVKKLGASKDLCLIPTIFCSLSAVLYLKTSSLFRPLKNGALTALLGRVQPKVRKIQSDIEGSNIVHLIFIILFVGMLT